MLNKQAVNADIGQMDREAKLASRDLSLDLFRTVSLVVVVVGHNLMALVHWDEDGVPVLDNTLAHLPRLHWITWIFQIMPLFFAAGAIVNAGSFRRALDATNSFSHDDLSTSESGRTDTSVGYLINPSVKDVRNTSVGPIGDTSFGNVRYSTWHTYCHWLYARFCRLLRPVFWYLIVWMPLAVGLDQLGGDRGAPLARLSTQLLWFLAVYLIVVATTPLQIWMSHKPYRLFGCLGLVVIVEWLGFNVVQVASVINFGLVWIGVGALGISLKRFENPRIWTVICGSALATNLVLASTQIWPVSMVGMPGEPRSNMAPPSLLLAIHAITQVAVMGMLSSRIDQRLKQSIRVQKILGVIGSMSMSLYLWHLTGLIGLVVIERFVGFDRGTPGDVGFWWRTGLHVAVGVSVGFALARIFAPLERRGLWYEKVRPRYEAVIPRHEAVTPELVKQSSGKLLVSKAALSLSVFLMAASMLALAGVGMAGFPLAVNRWSGIPLNALAAIFGMTLGFGTIRVMVNRLGGSI